MLIFSTSRYWVGQKSSYGYFHKIKDTIFFIFSNNHWFGYFDHVGNLQCGITLIVLSYCLDLIAVNFNWSTQHWSIILRCFILNLQDETSPTTFDTFNQSQHLLHTLHKSFVCVCFSYVFTFLEIIKHNMLKVLCIFFYLQY